ncbi:MAG: N-6 DNA methylase [Pirellulaceae bacterium]|nr:TaqI-like C-terminal specificity domain-containing protein [Thermoguttaceae bacterium]MDI9444815.1 TaqI-like C-terminal specificity domain-containing protein [Planctomycetota bacterium]NLZ00659.1 N-6 DNA methylase [Pirellulaceae bacterium]
MARQGLLPIIDFSDAVEALAAGNAEDRGAVFTRREVVEFILDLAGYTQDLPLYQFRILEPSFGNGDFLLPVVERLLAAYISHGKPSDAVHCLSSAIRAVEIHPDSIQRTRTRIAEVLASHGITKRGAAEILQSWIIHGDFLLADLPWKFTHAVGNPPYVRQELIPDVLLREYRSRYTTLYDRADVYVPFMERCLRRLEPGGTLGFICSDRWMKNRYGGPLRELVSREYHLAGYIDMVDTPAFHSDVTAYTAVTIIRREPPGPTRIAHRPRIAPEELARISQAIVAKDAPRNSDVVEIRGVANGREPWILDSLDQLALVRKLESQFPLLEEVGCKVGIGVATGADKVFIGRFDSLDVETSRKLPLVRTADIQNGTVQWQGFGVINPFNRDGTLVDLRRFPKLAGYLETHANVIRSRNCAKKNPRGWYRTIDRIHEHLTYQPKLLIPDIKGTAHVVYEDGRFYPHHNLYYITSDEWDLRALQAVLVSGIAHLFVSSYSTQMRGGYLRFQAQYLRRIRLPRWRDVPKRERDALVKSVGAGRSAACNRAVFDLYDLSPRERKMITGDGA